MHIREALQKATSPSLELLRAAESEIYRLDAILLESKIQKPMFYVRLRSDGGYEGPLHAERIEKMRLLSGAWNPLYLGDALTPRSFLEQFDLDQNEDYRKGYEDGRLRGFEVGLRYGKEQATSPDDRRKVQTANQPMRSTTDWPQSDPPVAPDRGDLVTLVGVKADGTDEVIGQATMSPLMKARELVRDVFGHPRWEGDDADLALCICEQLIEFMGKPAVVNVTRQAAQPTMIPTSDRILTACEKAGLWPNTAASWVANGAFQRFFKALQEDEA